ncbi:MAG: DUF5591 domain-containing protein [Thermoplasmata archaeon]|nr:DUF5591 domain-containing protein [Thermoplasmata archaeon]
MQFEIKKRDGPGRIATLTINGKKIVTPNIVYLGSKNIKPPKHAEIVITKNPLEKDFVQIQNLGSFFYQSKQSENADFTIPASMVYPHSLPDEFHIFSIKENKSNECFIWTGKKADLLKNTKSKVFILANATSIYPKSKEFIETIVSLRENIGYQKIVYLPGIANPSNLALLAYLGIDLFDNTQAILAARKKIFFSNIGNLKTNEIDQKICNCPACKPVKNHSEMSFEKLLQHNNHALLNELNLVRNMIKNARLRELVEIRCRNKPELVEKLRILEKNHYKYLEERTPVCRKTVLTATTLDSLNRPEIVRFRKRVLERYEKPVFKKILLLLPCSAKKPYRFSKSHKLFRETLNKVKNPAIIHELIITSPIGVVPRELDIVYPANTYDIPVTGYWFEDEKKMIIEQLTSFLKNNKYEKIVSHLPDELHNVISPLVKTSYHTCIDHPVSQKSLKKLKNILENLTQGFTGVDKKTILLEEVKCIAKYQFGRKPAEELLKNCEIKGREPWYTISFNDQQVGVISKDRGLISLTMQGGEKLLRSNSYWVEIEKGVELKGSLLAVGVKDADENIRVGDEVIIKNEDDNLVATGLAEMNGREMVESSRGTAVKIRHHK